MRGGSPAAGGISPARLYQSGARSTLFSTKGRKSLYPNQFRDPSPMPASQPTRFLDAAGLPAGIGATLCHSTAAVLESSSDAAGRGRGRVSSAGLGGSYRRQPAVEILRIGEVHRSLPFSETGGRRTVAIIDNGIDARHPFLRDALVGAWDLRSRPAGGPPAQAGHFSSRGATLQQSTGAILEGRRLPSRSGHATMVAGIVRLVAPAARLLSLRAFGDDGRASDDDLARAVRFAVRRGADVINMSFRLEGDSPALAAALHFARRSGVVCVAAAGNQATRLEAGALDGTLRVTSTDLDDRLSDFANRGAEHVALAAPGENVVTTRPGGGYVLASGTSFSTPFVAGAAALLAAGRQAAERTIEALRAGARPLARWPAAVACGRLDVAAAARRL